MEANVAFLESATSSHAGGEDNSVARLLGNEDILTKRHVCVFRALEKRGPDIGWASVKTSCCNRSYEDMVLQEWHGGGLVIWIPYTIESGIGNVFEGFIGRCNNLEDAM